MNSHVGSSVVDYAITDMDPANIGAFLVTPQTHLSDHNQLLLYIKSTRDPPAQRLQQTGLFTLPPTYKWSKMSAIKYKEALDKPEIQKMLHNFYNNVYEINPQGVDQAVRDLNNIFYTMAEMSDMKRCNHKRPKEKQPSSWFDSECKAVRKTLRMTSNKKHRDPNNTDLREAYDTIQRQYKTLLRKKKQSHISTKLNQLQDALQDNSFWELWNGMGTNEKKNNLGIQNGNIWLQYFRELYRDIPKEERIPEQEQLQKKLTAMEETIKDFQNPLDGPITPQEISERTSLIRCRKASGIDGIAPEMLKYSPPEILTAIAKLFNIVLSAGYFPDTWNQGLITPIHKSGDRYDPANYRGICVSSNLGKLLNGILNQRITSFLTQHNVLSKSQAGFMPNHRTTDHIYTLHSLIGSHVHDKKKGKIYACFVDFKKAFDSVWHPGLFLKLLESGIGGKTYDVIRSSYTENRCSVKVNGRRTAYFQQSRGVRQGCSLSPTLFNIYINELATALESSSAPGLTLHDTEIKFLLYADDLLLLSPTEKGLQDQLLILEKFSTTWALPINQKKTNIVVFQKRKNKSTGRPSFTLHDRPLTATDRYTYLGLEIHHTGNLKPAIETLKDKARKTFYAIRRRLYRLKPPVTVWLKIFDSVIAPILLYGSEVWGPHTYPDWARWDSSPTEIFHLEFCKHLLQVHRCTSNSACRSELGRFPLRLAIQKRALSFWGHLHNSSQDSYHHKALLHQGAKRKVGPQNQIAQTQADQRTTQHGLTKAAIKNTIIKGQEEHISHWKKEVSTSRKLEVYQRLQRDYRLATYLEKLEKPRDRQILSRYRLSAHSLAIESGRHKQSYLPRERRLCQHCPQETIEDEVHFLLQCPKYSAVRDTHFTRLSDLFPDFSTMEEEEKLQILLGEEETTMAIAAQYVSACHRLREA